MACVILPSETARLVYGYLVKENLNDIALQFLESSPYLTDCYQIVKSGYQFNTKLMNKDLQELLQEYSVIHNLVTNKVSMLCKTSLLYKRIKLKCESLPEILELILFWKYRNSKSGENLLTPEKSVNCVGSQLPSTCNEIPVTSEIVTSKVNDGSNSNEKTCSEDDNTNLIQNNDINVTDGFHSKLCCESYSENKNSVENHEQIESSNNSNKCNTPVYVPLPDISESSDSNKNNNNIDNNIVVNGNMMPEENVNDNPAIMTINPNEQSENLIMSALPPGNLEPHHEHQSEFESQIKIVGIEENQNVNHTLGVFSKALEDGNENMTLDNSSVVFVGSNVGNVTIDQERSQIIVIPIDYYKAEEEMQKRMEIDNIEKQGLTQKEDIVEVAAITSASPENLYNDKISSVDDNIITEKDFLNNKQLLYNLEKELNKSEFQPQKHLQTSQPSQQVQESSGNIALCPASAPVILVSQAVPQPMPPRYRTILPKKKCSPKPIHPIVVVHPLLETNKDLTTLNSNTVKAQPNSNRSKKKRGQKIKKKNLSGQNQKIHTKNSKNLNMPCIKPTDSEEDLNITKSDKEANSEEPSKEADKDKKNEEKENLEKSENKKTETPVVVMKRNSKKLSLSTPRRKSHIRALDFETPPKTVEGGKKSKTSPKMKFEKKTLERKSVRSTLFKSPILENSFKLPGLNESTNNVSEQAPKSSDVIEPLSELSIPIATRSPNTKLSDAWENLTGVGCVIGQPEPQKTSPVKKMWDADLRCFISNNNQSKEPLEKKRVRKPEKNQKDNRKTVRKKVVSTKKSKPSTMTVSPSKMSLTAKRNTYSINGNEEGSPVRSLIDDLKIVTPFKDIETVRPTEETPLTKLLRENINSIDIDLSMINTPSFPPTPSIIITPDLDDLSMAGANYYSPSKDCSKDKILKLTDYFKVEPEKSAKKESREMHEKVIDDLVSKAKEIIGLGKENQEENTLKRRPSGKILSMVKIQMLTQCDKKLCENIPINEDSSFANQKTMVGNLLNDATGKNDLKEELEEKRKRALKKIKVVKENLSTSKNTVTKRARKRKRSGNATKSDKSKSDTSSESINEKFDSDGSVQKEVTIFHSTPYSDKSLGSLEQTNSDKKVDCRFLEDIRQEFPPFVNSDNIYPELSEKSRKKLHYVESFLKLPEITKFINDFNNENYPKLFLKSSLRRFFQVFYKWLKHPHKREVNASTETKALLQEYLSLFSKVNKGLMNRSKELRKECNATDRLVDSAIFDTSENRLEKPHLSDDDDRDWKRRENKRRKDEDIEDGVVSTLPLKKRKSTVQQVELKTAVTVSEKGDSKHSSTETVSQTQNFLQDIDVDRFLSQIHGQENR